MLTSQNKIAKRLGISQGLVSMLVNGKRAARYPLAKKIAKICKCRPEVFMEKDAARVREAFYKRFGYLHWGR